MNRLYSFVYRGVLTDESLDKVGRKKREDFGAERADKLRQALSYELLDEDMLIQAERMSIIYTALHVFENMVREFVKNALAEEYKEDWWSRVPAKVSKKAKSRIEEEAKFKWHSGRGVSEIEYCDFGDLSSIIVTNWEVFDEILQDMDWAKAIFHVLERSRNIVMHGGVLERQDIERIGGHIRDWIRQVG